MIGTSPPTTSSRNTYSSTHITLPQHLRNNRSYKWYMVFNCSCVCVVQAGYENCSGQLMRDNSDLSCDILLADRAEAPHHQHWFAMRGDDPVLMSRCQSSLSVAAAESMKRCRDAVLLQHGLPSRHVTLRWVAWAVRWVYNVPRSTFSTLHPQSAVYCAIDTFLTHTTPSLQVTRWISRIQ